MDRYKELREEVVRYSKLMYDEKLVAATSGNISARLPDRKDAFAITPSSENYPTMTADRIVIMTLDGEILQCPEGARPSSEWRLHAELYRAKENVNAIVHTHSPYASAFAVIREPIPVVLVGMNPILGGAIPLSEYAPAGSLQVGLNAARDIGDKGGLLMENHGAVAVAGTLERAYLRATCIEDSAKIYHLARCVGKPVTIES